jgi:hypothetical protein
MCRVCPDKERFLSRARARRRLGRNANRIEAPHAFPSPKNGAPCSGVGTIGADIVAEDQLLYYKYWFALEGEHDRAPVRARGLQVYTSDVVGHIRLYEAGVTYEMREALAHAAAKRELIAKRAASRLDPTEYPNTAGGTGEASVDPLRWGLLPYWRKGPNWRAQTDQQTGNDDPLDLGAAPLGGGRLTVAAVRG